MNVQIQKHWKKAAISLAGLGLASLAYLKTSTPSIPEFDQDALDRMTEQILEAAGDRQFLAFGETNHTLLPIAWLGAQESMMQAYAEHGYRHLILECPPEIEPLLRQYQNGEIPRDVFSVMFEQFTEQINMVDAKTATLLDNAFKDSVRLAGQYNLTVHCADVAGEGILDPEHRDFYISFQHEFIERFKNKFLENPDLVSEGLLKQNQVRALTFQEVVDEKEQEFGQWVSDAESWTPEEGAPRDNNERIRYRLILGDPKVYEYIQQRVGDEKAVIFYGYGHFMRRTGDIDAGLGDENVFVIEVYADRNEQIRDVRRDRSINAQIIGQTFNFERPNATIDLSNMTFE